MTKSAYLGRPRQFDLQDAARDAMNVFWDRGYEGASLPDLIQGTGLSRGSLYKAFGDKKGLLLAALEIYMAEGLKTTADILSQPGTVKDAIRQSLLRHAYACADEAGKRGCLVVAVASEMAAHDPEIARLTGRMFRRTQQLYASAVIRGQAAGEFKEGDEQAKARFLVGHIHRTRVLGKTGVSRADMIALVDTALIILS
jgi:TetR/AcrR family transcriptional repressor of nem operon